MQSKQYILLGTAACLIAVLAFLPKVVVSSKQDTNAEKNESIVEASSSPNQNSSLPEGHSEDDGHDHSESDTQNTATNHMMNVSEEDKKILEKLRTEYFEVLNKKNTSNEEESIALEKFVEQFKRINLFDSAAYYLAQEAKKKPTLENHLRAADAHYEASVFAVNPKKAGTAAEKARKYYELVLKEDPKNNDAKAQLAMTYVSTPNPMQGIAMLRQIIEEDPNHAQAIENLGLLSIQSGQYDKAVSRFERLIELKPEDVSVRLYLGVSYKEIGAAEKAKKELEFVFNNTTDPALKEAAKEYLRGL